MSQSKSCCPSRSCAASRGPPAATAAADDVTINALNKQQIAPRRMNLPPLTKRQSCAAEGPEHNSATPRYWCDARVAPDAKSNNFCSGDGRAVVRCLACVAPAASQATRSSLSH
jgi:hypothetical protein